MIPPGHQRRPGRHLVPLLLGGLAALAGAETTRVTSPNGEHTLALVFKGGDDAKDGGGLTYAITSGNEDVVAATPISLTLGGSTRPAAGSILAKESREVRGTTTAVVPTHAASFPDAFNEVSLDFSDGITLRARAYDDGVAFRWETRLPAEEVTVDAEQLALTLASDFPLYFPESTADGFFSHQECNFARMRASAIGDHVPGPVPLLVELGNDRWMLLTDVDVEHYPGLWIRGGGGSTIDAVFPPYPLETELEGDRGLRVSKAAPFIARTAGTATFPWRAFVLADGAGLLTPTMLHNLAEPSRIEDPSWIRPGKVAWDWWNANNIHGVPFRAGINQATYRHYIDFAAEMGLPYVILDEGWSVRGPDRLLEVVPEIDLPALVDHARDRDVRLILWMTSVALERSFDRAFEQFAEWGIAGIKVDFMQRDDQPMMEFLHRTAEAAARHRLIVDFHGGSKPTGIQRTWPNVLTLESVPGLEQSKWCAEASPGMATLLPFTRMVAGPMDYTPGAMNNLQEKTFQPMFETPASQGTRAHQLALYVVFLSPLQMLADSPTNYRRNPGCLPFLREVPTTWDETRVLVAEVGRCVAVARRKGDDWYLGAITDWDARDLELPLDFLPGGAFELSLWKDGPNADRNGNDFAVETRTVTRGDSLGVHLAPGGGLAAILKPRPGNADRPESAEPAGEN